MTDLTVILLCAASYIIGGIAGMGALLVIGQAKRADRIEAANVR